jgi:gamma-glutamylputrescine oxidase
MLNERRAEHARNARAELAAASENANSWYASTANTAALRPSMQGHDDCDVCVVGGGIAGCSAALHLARRGYRVILLEQQHIGWGASGRSGAQALFGLAIAQHKLAKLVGDADAHLAFDITVEGLKLLKSLITEHRIDCDWVPGQIHAAIKPRQDRELQLWAEDLQRNYQYQSLRLLGRAELREFVASERYSSGLLDSQSGHLHPLNYTLGLAAAAERAGVRICEHSRALSWASVGGNAAGTGPVVLRTQRGEVRCSQLVFCGNAWLGDTAPALSRKIMAVSTYMVATEPLGEAAARALLPQDSAVTDVNWVLDYFRRSIDHRLLFGGRVSYSGLDALNSAEKTRCRLLKVFPQLGSARIDFSWGGYVDITLNRAPHFGRLQPNVYFLQGFSGHGIVLGGIAGKLIAEAISGSAERFDVFARIPHRDFPGGLALRRPALVLGMLWYRLRDLL